MMDIDLYLQTDSDTVTELARRVGVPQPLLSQWRTGARRVPAGRCPDIERETGGVVRCEELRPDIDWAVLRNSPPDPPCHAGCASDSCVAGGCAFAEGGV